MEIQTTVQAAISEDIRYKPSANTTQLNNSKEDPNEIIILNETRTTSPPPFQCLICFTFFSDPKILNKHVFETHVTSVHEKNKPFFVENGGFNGSGIELVSKESNHLAAILHVYAGGLKFMK